MKFGQLVVLLFVINVGGLAHGKMPEQDTVKGAKDHPVMSRFQGSKLVGFGAKEFDEVVLPAGKQLPNKEGKRSFESLLRLEGKYTRIAYNFAKERSSLEVMRNYQAALEQAGLQTVYSCAKESCGADFGDLFMGRIESAFVQGGDYWSPFNYGRLEPRYVLAKAVRPDGSQVHVAVYVVPPVQDKNGGVYLEIVEAKAMDAGKVSANLDAAEMAKGIAAEGKIAVYGVHFDTGKADIKPESKSALTEMASLLQKDAALKVYVVGHTDNQGALAPNMELSQKRADSVVKALTTDYKIDGKRLSAKGVASYAPVSSNDNEAGRNKNRRVELVKQ